MIFTVNFDKWVLAMLPTFMRRRVIFAFCRAMTAPIVKLHKQFVSARESHLFSLGHSGQVCYLRAALNETFGTGGASGFDIIDDSTNRGEWIYAKHEDMTNQLYAVDENLNNELEEGAIPEHATPVLGNEYQLNVPLNSFVVLVPSILYYNQLDKVMAVVDKYRLPSKTPIYQRK
jgi:hypothetical protein